MHEVKRFENGLTLKVQDLNQYGVDPFKHLELQALDNMVLDISIDR